MTVSILVPVYQVEKYIEECANSLFAQTYPYIEYVFCDDCSTDRSMEILKKVTERYQHRKRNVTIIQNERNTGIGATRANLINAVKTDFFFFADSDDILPVNAIEVLIKQMKKSNTDYVEGAFCYYTNGSPAISVMPNHDNMEKYRKQVQVCDLIRHQVWGKLYKTEVTRLVSDLFLDGINMAEDYCATTRLAAVATRSWTDETVYYYRADQQSFFIKEMSDKNIRSYLKATRVVLDFYLKRGPLSLPIEIGILRAYRQCYIEKGMTLEMVEKIVGFSPERIVSKLLKRVLCSALIPFVAKNLIYKVIRTLAIIC